ncbi:hypothetical protein Bca52824_058746 [Brassica carinata]|uniref:F-box domain-containing protein n=1 Tax=Brassica carinata TaxID=52824 RepID=A0A8X7QU67_BRACI|nr:hypothetical protein Bca52824_058746 [Brassica carinata]
MASSKSTPIADEKKFEERIKKKRSVTMEHVFTGSGILEPGSYSGKQAMDADGSSDEDDDDDDEDADEDDDDEFDQWFRRTAGEMSFSDYFLSNILSKSNAYEWSVVVAPGRYVTVHPGPLLLIKKISYVPNPPTIIPGDPGCQLYLGVDRTRAESVIGHLIPGFQNEIEVHLPMNETFTIGHSGFERVRFSGYRYVVQGQPEPPPSELRVTAPERRRSTNPRQWTLPLELTSKVFSYLSSSDVAKAAERVCPFFRAAGRDPYAYSDVDLCNLRYGETLIALMCIRRANLAIKSLAVGFSYGPGDFDLNRMYSGRFLEPLQYLGRGLKKLKLVGLDLIGPEHLTPVFAVCAVLTNLELHKLGLVTLEYAMSVASEHCIQLQSFEYSSKEPEDGVLGAVSDATLQRFLTSIPHLTSICLCGVHISDTQLILLLRGRKKLTSLDLSGSSVFTGSFLGDLLNEELVLEVLLLRRCIDLQEVQLKVFFTNLGDKPLFFQKMEDLVITGFQNGGLLQEGFEGRIGRDALLVARPAIKISTYFEGEPAVVFVQAELDRFIFDSFDPVADGDRVGNEAHREWEVQVSDEELDREVYAILGNGVRRKRKMLVYWSEERRDQDV